MPRFILTAAQRRALLQVVERDLQTLDASQLVNRAADYLALTMDELVAAVEPRIVMLQQEKETRRLAIDAEAAAAKTQLAAEEADLAALLAVLDP